MSILTILEIISAAFILAFALLAAVAILTTVVLRAMDKGRREPKQRDDTVWHTFWRQDG